MSYSMEARRAGRRPITLAELDFERCSLAYGVSPCTAAVGTTGADKCYNTRGTCQDTANFAPETVTYRFCEPRSDLPPGFDAIPALRGVTTAATKLEVGQGLGQRSSASITLQDFASHDRLMDPYVNERVAPAQGTFWGRFRARNPYYFGRACRIKTGYLTDAGVLAENMVTRTYVIEQFAGPDIGGKVQITAKGLLKLADDQRAQAPAPSSGVLLADITAIATTATLSPTGIGSAEYPASGFVRIGKEVASFTRSGDTLTLVRALWNTVASDHDANDTAQLCLFYSSQTLDVICADLLANYARVPSAYLPTTAWAMEVAAYLPRTYTARITEPVGVNQLLTELVQQAPFYLFDDERSAQIKLRAIRGPDSGAPVLTDASHFVAGSLSIADQPDQWLSEVWVYIGQIDPTEPLNKAGNFRQLVISADLESEQAVTNNRKSIRKLFSRWLTSKSAADDLGSQLLDRFGETPRLVSFVLDAKDYALWTGDVCQLQTRIAQSVTGDLATLTAQVVEASESNVAHQFKYSTLAFRYVPDAGVTRVVTVSSDQRNFDFYAAYVAQYGTPSAAVDAACVVEIGVVIGSSSNSVPAFTVSAFPSGSNLALEINGRIEGAGGLGSIGSNGGPGGVALSVDQSITVDNIGEIWGGGGGGAAAVQFVSGEPYYAGGGGGAGDVPGGAAGSADFFTAPGQPGTRVSGGIGGHVGSPANITGGAGGPPGQVGQSRSPRVGGAAGAAVVGSSYITWLTTGDRRGAIT